MNLLKRMSALVMVMALLVSAFVAPASAEAVGYPYSGHFSKFPGVWSSKQYSVATVAVQKFLMLAGESRQTDHACWWCRRILRRQDG